MMQRITKATGSWGGPATSQLKAMAPTAVTATALMYATTLVGHRRAGTRLRSVIGLR